MSDQLPQPTQAEADKARQKARSKAIAIGLILFAVLFYFLTIFKMGPGILKRGL
jgi:hypothetical protein